MIKALLLILEPTLAWEEIAIARKSIPRLVVFYFVPMISLMIGVELAGLVFLGHYQEFDAVSKIPLTRTIVYGVCEWCLSFAVVFISTKIVKSLAETFQTRHPINQCFTVVVYALSPLFLVRLLNAIPSMNPWVTFAIGMVLCLATLYHGLPRILQPDPPHAFGLYLTTCLLLTGVAGLAQCVSWLVLTGRFGKW